MIRYSENFEDLKYCGRETWIVCCDCWLEWGPISHNTGYIDAKKKYDEAVDKFMSNDDHENS